MSIGYACIALGISGLSLKGCTLRYATEEKLRHIILHNLWVLNDVIDYNLNNGIMLFRISSDIIPFGSHQINRLEWWSDYSGFLSEIGEKIKESGMRVSMHPGQYTVLNSPDMMVVIRAVEDLHYHARFLDSLGADNSHKIVLHIGGTYGNKEQSAARFTENFCSLPDFIKCRLVLENDERSYNIADVLSIAGKISVPVVYDNLHHQLNKPNMDQLAESDRKASGSTPFDIGDLPGPSSASIDPTPARWIEKCSNTWKPKDGRQKIHYSQQLAGGRPGLHSSTIDTDEFIAFFCSLKDPKPDIMLEVKDKNLSALKCINAVEELTRIHEKERLDI